MTKKQGPDTHHVVPDSNNDGWKVVRDGSERASGLYDTKKEAIDAGREISRNQDTEFRVHNKDGKIASSDSHGNDPRKIKG